MVVKLCSKHMPYGSWVKYRLLAWLLVEKDTLDGLFSVLPRELDPVHHFPRSLLKQGLLLKPGTSFAALTPDRVDGAILC